jgi:hypothetical protein
LQRGSRYRHQRGERCALLLSPMKARDPSRTEVRDHDEANEDHR